MADIFKSYVLTWDERLGYLYAHLWSHQMTAEIAFEYLREAAEKCKELGYDKLLIYRDVPVMLPDADLFEATTFFLKLMEGRRVAFVNPHAEIAEDMDYAVTIGTNRGANYRLFNNFEPAEKWLLE